MSLVHHPAISPKLVLLDGVSGTGKTLLSPLLGHLSGFSPPRFYYPIEWVSVGLKAGKIDATFAEAWFNLVFDQLVYDAQLSRELNFRPGDLSTALLRGRRLTTLVNLLRKDGPQVGRAIQEKGRGITVITHQLFPTFSLLLPILPPHALVIEAVRRPSDLLEHWATYVGRHGTSNTDFTLLHQTKMGPVPWFYKSDHESFFASDDINRAGLLLADLFDDLFAVRREKPDQVLFVPFEIFTRSPHQYLADLCARLGTTWRKSLRGEMVRQKVPRHQGASGPSNRAYDRYSYSRSSRRDPQNSTGDFLQLLRPKIRTRMRLMDEEYRHNFLLD